MFTIEPVVLVAKQLGYDASVTG